VYTIYRKNLQGLSDKKIMHVLK